MMDPAPFWTPDPAFAGRVVVVIGGGPSHADLDLNALAGVRFFAINSACRKVRPAATADDPLYFTDGSWNEAYPDLARDWPGPVITSNRNVKARLGDAVRRLDIVALTERIGALPDHVQASSAHSAACLAAVMGAARVVLIGCDCGPVNGRTHGHEDYRQADLSFYRDRCIPGWRGVATALQRMGVDLVTAAPASAIEGVPFVPLPEATSPH